MSRPILPETSRSWRYFPWLFGVGIAPLLYGSVPPWAQAVVGLLFGTSLLLTADESAVPRPLLPKSLIFLVLLFCGVIFIPLGPSVLKILSPGAAYLAEHFPVEPGPPVSHPLTISTALSLARLWQLCLIVSSFVLARRAFRSGFSPLSLLIIVCLSIAALGLAEFSRRWIGWSPFKLPGTGAGTFANRNHFASWIYTATLFALGGLLRAFGPLRSARRGSIVDRGTVVALLVLVAVPAGCAAALVSASRGALAAFVLGCAVWALFIGTRSRSRQRKAVLMVLGMLALFPLIHTAGAVLDRLARTTETLGFKSQIWADSLRLLPPFPWFGTGPGSFVVAFNHFKTFRGESTFLFVENDWIQLMVETGLVGLGLSLGIALLLVSRLGRSLWREKFSEPELVFGAAAGVVAFAFHALGEFVTYVPANAILTATFVGLIAGARDEPASSDPAACGSGRMRGTPCLAGLILLCLSLLQGAASWNAWKGLSVFDPPKQIEYFQRALKVWPIETRWALALSRARVLARDQAERPAQQQNAQLARADLNRALRWNPYDWELRLERAWLDLAFENDRSVGIREAWGTTRLNPLQPSIPLRFARHFATRNPQEAIAFLHAVNLQKPSTFRFVLDQAWEVQADSALLWELTPDRPDTLLTLAHFALSHRLSGVAVEALGRLRGRVDPLILAELYVETARPELAIQMLIDSASSDAARLLLARAYLKAGDYSRSLEFSGKILQRADFGPPSATSASAAVGLAQEALKRR